MAPPVRWLPSDKGVVLCVRYQGTACTWAGFKDVQGASKQVRVDWTQLLPTARVGDRLFLHVDPDTAEILIATREPLPY